MATLQSLQKISDNQGGFTGVLNSGDALGWSVVALGDLDADDRFGTSDLIALLSDCRARM